MDRTPSLAQLSSINLQHLRYAVAAADHGSFRQAAEFLAVRQSTLSRSIRQFERSVGVAIFERSSSGIKRTSAGRNVLRMARTILKELDALLLVARSNRAGAVGQLAI